MDFTIAWRNITRKKALYLLLWLTIALSALTVLLTLTFRESAVSLRMEQLRTDTLNTQLAVLTKNEEDIYFRASSVDAALQHANIRHRIPRLVAGGMLRERPVHVMGLDLAEQERALPFSFLSRSTTKDAFEGLLVSDTFSKEHAITIDDAVSIQTERGELAITVTGICEDTGVFSDPNLAVVSIAQMQALFGEDRVSSVGLTLSDLSQVETTNEAVAQRLPETLMVEQRYDVSGYQAYVGTVAMALSIFSFFSITMAILMMTSISRRILEERRQQIGIQRSLGTSRRRLFFQVMAENLLVLLFAVAAAAFLYPFAMNGILRLIGMPGGGVAIPADALLLTGGGFVGVGIFSVLLSLAGIFGTPVLELLKGASGGRMTSLFVGRIFIGVLSLAGAFWLYVRDDHMLLTALVLPLFLFGVIAMLPAFHILGVRLLRVLTGGIRSLRMPLVSMERRFPDYAQSMMLLVLILCVLSVSLQLSFIIRSNVAAVYGDTDVLVHSYEKMEQELKKDADVISIIRQERYLTRYDDRKLELAGIEPDSYVQIAFENSEIGFDQSLARLKSEPDGILITTTLAKNSGLEEGDRLDLGAYGSYTVIGLISSLEMSGDVQFVNMAKLQEIQIPDKEYRYFLKYREEADVEQKAQALNKTYENRPFSASSMDAVRKQDAESTGQIFSIIYALFGMTFVAGLITLMNNLWVSVFRQKTPIGVQRSLGLSAGRFLMEQAVTGLVLGVTGGLIGLGTGSLLAYPVAQLMNYFIGAIKVQPDWASLGLMLTGSAVACVVATVLPGQQMAKRPIIESIKGREA